MPFSLDILNDDSNVILPFPMLGLRPEWSLYMLDQICDAAVLINSERRVTWYNKSAEFMLGVARSKAMGRIGCDELLQCPAAQPDDTLADAGHCPPRRVLESGLSIPSRLLTIIRPDEQLVVADTSFSRVVLAEQDGFYCLAVLRDVTAETFERIRKEEEDRDAALHW